MPGEVLHFGGNGHASVRLERAVVALGGSPGLLDVPYPGFEGRPAPASREDFFEEVGAFCRGAGSGALAGYASGIGALVALGLRARGEIAALPLIFQGPVLWGLERRAFPRWMRRVPPARRLLHKMFATRPFQEHFARKQFRRPPTEPVKARFFEGYARCAAFGDVFEWFGPDWLRRLEREFAAHPERLGKLTVWLGGRDPVIGPDEVAVTERTLGVCWPRVVFPEWGHYPMLDVPEEWAAALRNALATA